MEKGKYIIYDNGKIRINWDAVDAEVDKQRDFELLRVIENLRGEHGAIKAVLNWADYAEIIAENCKTHREYHAENYKAALEVANLAATIDNLVDRLKWYAEMLRNSATALNYDGIRDALNGYHKRKIKELENKVEELYARR